MMKSRPSLGSILGNDRSSEAIRSKRETFSATKHQKSLQQGILILVALLISEGILRKIFSFLSVPLFFAKDILTLYLGMKAVLGKLPEVAEKILTWQVVLLILMMPNFLDTSFKDPVLGVFGLKQYCLFPLVAVAACAAYLPDQREPFRKLLTFLALSLIATTSVAILQNKLGPAHWLNKTPDGESLGGFAAGGKLRVSSTFIFVAQYAMYLNPMVGFLAAYLVLRKKPIGILQKILPLVLLVLFIVGIFITGGRGAVVGCLAITLAGTVALFFTSGAAKAVRVFLFLGCAALAYVTVHTVFPDAFAAYDARTADAAGESHNQEVILRVISGMVDWTRTIKSLPFLGNGLGIQSNGSEKLSAYASLMRDRWGWMETDQHVVIFEGGMYLVVIWYALRLFVISFTGITMLGIRSPSMATAAAFCWAYVLIIGITGTLSIQPAMSIWWWLSVGIILCLREFDRKTPHLQSG